MNCLFLLTCIFFVFAQKYDSTIISIIFLHISDHCNNQVPYNEIHLVNKLINNNNNLFPLLLGILGLGSWSRFHNWSLPFKSMLPEEWPGWQDNQTRQSEAPQNNEDSGRQALDVESPYEADNTK